MTSKKRPIPTIKRDVIIADAVNRALYAMKLVNGIVIGSEGEHETLQFDHEMARLEKALRLLHGDPDGDLPTVLRH